MMACGALLITACAFVKARAGPDRAWLTAARRPTVDGLSLRSVAHGSELALFQATAKYRSKSSRPAFNDTHLHKMNAYREPSIKLDDFSDSTWLTAMEDDVTADVCGARPMMPSLQFEMEVYWKLGILSSHYARCRVASSEFLFSHTSTDSSPSKEYLFKNHVHPHFPHNTRTRLSKLVVTIWFLCAIYMTASFALGAFRGARAGKPKNMMRAYWGYAVSWLDPIISRYSSLHADQIDIQAINELEPDFQFEPYSGIRQVWQDEIATKGLENACLFTALRRFLGASVVAKMFVAVSLTTILEFAGMTIVLDVLVNYLRWASDANAKLPFVALDTLGPTIMIIALGMGVPLLTRYCSSATSISDGLNNNRMVAGLLCLIYEKSQRLPMSELPKANEDARVDVNHLVSNDVIKVSNGALKSFTQLLITPICMSVFFGVLVHRLGFPALLGGAAAFSICLIYIPAIQLVRRGNLRWLQQTDKRASLMKEAIFNIRTLKGFSNEQAISNRVYAAREEELQTKLAFSMAQSFMNIPLNLLPFLLICCCLLSTSMLKGKIDAHDIFTCMEVLAGLVACTATFGSAMQKTLNVPNSIKRIEAFLKEPEKPKKPKQEETRHPSAPVAQVSGSFAHIPGAEASLHDVDVVVRRGELVAVVGETGSGKSTLLTAMLGELNGVDGKSRVDVPDQVAYCAQTPWFINGPLHENITLGEAVDRQRYEEALTAASLATRSDLDKKEAPEEQVAPGAQGKEQRQQRLEAQPEEAQPAPHFYFFMWNIFVFIALALGVINVDWAKTPMSLGLLIVAIQGCLHWSVMEIPLQTIATFFTKEPPKPKRADGSHLTLCLNYNLLAVSQADVDECMENMYLAYMGSISENVSAVLVSATNDPSLKDYELQVRDDCRERIYKELIHEGLVWAGFEQGKVDAGRKERVWSRFQRIERQEFAQVYLTPLCKRFANEFMVLHRVSRVLRKCGQYQDLMLLSEGMDRAFTYTDESLYFGAARPFGQPLFHDSLDTSNVKGRHFDYTLVLDADTCVIPDSVFEMLEIGAGNPERAIIQPAITMDCRPGDSIFIHIEAMRQTINAPLTNTLTALLGECGFYGKGLVKNTAYIAKCLGTPEEPIEVVPIDVLSHDTFEAAVVGPLYAGDVPLLEAPCGNYVTWDIRERRWNRGEVLLAMYFFPEWVGAPMRWMQNKLQGKTFKATQVRTKAQLGDVSEYMAHAALRQIVMKPLLVIYIVLMDFVEMHYEWTPIIVVMFLIIVFPKFAICKRDNCRAVMLETIASILQFTPECVVGTIRILRALKAHLTGNAQWVPQRAVEEEFEKTNPFIFSLNYLWYYPCFAFASGLVVASLIPDGIFIMWMLGTLFTLPLYAGFTALKTSKQDEISRFPYFSLWNACAGVAIFLSFLNVDWGHTPATLGLLVVGIQGVLHWSVMEIPLQTMATFFTKTAPKPKRADGTHLKMCLNYNLLATAEADVDECMENMYLAFMGNISENVSAILVSATNDPSLKEYELHVRDQCRERIYKELEHEGLVWAGFEDGKVDVGRHQRVWSKFQNIGRQEFRDVQLPQTCESFAREFMVLHRVSRVLRKCGQYQDLMLLSSGYSNAFTYCDPQLYNEAARPLGEPLFHASADCDNVYNRGFDYTLVLDADTGVVPNSVFELLDVGAGNPERAIIQPAIQMDCRPGDSIFIHIEAMRQSINAPLTNTLTALLGECGFYGKGLVKNSQYIAKCLGTPENPIEVVPIDVLSHDTFEAAVVGPLYAGDVHLLEAPCGNYVTWDIRERRWNRGEVLLAMYFFPEWVGVPMRWMQSKLQGKQFNETKVRTKAELGPISEYMAHAALRQIVLKPVLVAYIIMMDFVEMYYEWTPFITAMFLIIVFPKIATCTCANFRAVILETTASILQFTPECVVGTIRILRALKAHLTGNAKWIPQRAVEEEFEKSNPFLFSLTFLWYYPVFALAAGVVVSNLIPEGIFIMWMLGTLFTLPLYAGFTALRTPKKFTTDDDDHAKDVIAAAKLRVNDTEKTTGQELDSTPPIVAIGPRGSYLSASERAQVAFARAAYWRRADLVLLDDPFASLDKHTTSSVMRSLVGSPLFEGRARVVSMQPRADLLRHFDRVLVLDGGRIVAEGPPAEVISRPVFCDLMAKHDGPTTNPGTSSANASELRILTGQNGRPLVDVAETPGRNRWSAIAETALSGGPRRLVLATFVVLLLRVTVMGVVLLLGVWADHVEAYSMEVHDIHFIQIMAIGILISGVLQVSQNYLVLTFSTAASKTLFHKSFSSLLKAPIDSFWGRQPTGRIVNRLLADMATVDVSFSTGFLALSGFIFSVLVQQVYCLVVMPKLLALPMYLAIGSFAFYCWSASTPLQYFSMMALSTCQDEQAHATASAVSVRAYKQQGKQITQYCGKASAIVKPNFLGVACAKQWLSVRITFCLCFQCTACMLCGVLRPNAVNIGTLAMIALSTFNLLQEMDGFIDTLMNNITVGISLQRLTEYFRKSPESTKPEQTSRDLVAQEHAQKVLQGGAALQVNWLSVNYSGRTNEAIAGVNISLEAGSWLAVVGPAGAGKTALLLGISQILRPSEGHVLLGDIDLRKCEQAHPELLHLMVRYVPQEPAIFQGSIRFNVDPTGECSDDQVWQMLKCAQLSSAVGELSDGLDHVISKEFGALSFGQRQLLCVARALCETPCLLLLDGSLSAVDQSTLHAVRRAIAASLPKTIVVMATQTVERISSFDHVIMLENGTMVKQFAVDQLMT